MGSKRIGFVQEILVLLWKMMELNKVECVCLSVRTYVFVYISLHVCVHICYPHSNH